MIKYILIALFATAQCAFPIGQSAVITLVFPPGARSLGMGEVGTALADDEDVLYYNPAGLGMQNNRWHGGATTDFYQQLLPVGRRLSTGVVGVGRVWPLFQHDQFRR